VTKTSWAIAIEGVFGTIVKNDSGATHCATVGHRLTAVCKTKTIVGETLGFVYNPLHIDFWFWLNINV
jgi:hypothetical protein